MKPVTIYTISDVSTGYVYYVGATIQPLKKRLSGHTGTYQSAGMKRLIESGVELNIEPIETCPFEEAADTEYYWVLQFRAWGFDLINSRIRLPYSDVSRKGDVIIRDNEAIEQFGITGKLIRTYDNIYEAANNGFDICRISHALIGNQKTHAGYKWKFKNDKDFPPYLILGNYEPLKQIETV